MPAITDVAIIGCGPYGLSLAAHLRALGINFRIFGQPMGVWREHMPLGMHLKSDGFASNLYDPRRQFTLRQYCQDFGIPYADYGLPVRLDTFVNYGLAFQQQCVPTAEDKSVERLYREDGLFMLELSTGAPVMARTVVVATGISHFGYVPESLQSLPADLCAHSSAYHDLARFAHQRVAVMGGGASATDIAAILKLNGADVTLIARHAIEFHLPPSATPPSLWKRMTEPNLGLGPNFRSAVYTAVPGLVHRLPRRLRLRVVRRHLGPAGGWFMNDQVIGKLPIHTGYDVAATTTASGAVRLQLSSGDGRSLEVIADHVIAATGYRVAVSRLGFLDPPIRAAIRLEDQSPLLSGNFESSVGGLFFIGVASANSFGPVMRFARGAEYAAQRLSRTLAARGSGS